MPNNLSASEQLTYSTVRMECELSSGGVSCGTGFFYRFAQEGDRHIPAIVTNKHVIKKAVRGQFHLHTCDDQDNPLPSQHKAVIMDNFEQSWIPHPENDVDLCIMPIAPLINHAHEQVMKPFYIFLDPSLIPTVGELADLTVMEDIIMIGYPNGIWDEVNNMPIIRRGITATHPNINYNGKAEFMIDAACFPGSSGSPVYLFNLGAYATKSGSTVIGTRVKLLGVLYAGPQHTVTGNIKIITVPTQQLPISRSTIPNNLGNVIKSQKLLDFEPILKRLQQL